MKTLTLELPDEVYERAERRAAMRGTSLGQEAVELLTQFGADNDDQTLAAARSRMRELFQTISGFRVAPRMSREELYDRQCLR